MTQVKNSNEIAAYEKGIRNKALLLRKIDWEESQNNKDLLLDFTLGESVFSWFSEIEFYACCID